MAKICGVTEFMDMKMDLYSIYNKMKQFNEIIIFGFYEMGIDIKNTIRNFSGERSIIFCDNNPVKWNNNDVISVEDAVSKHKNAMFIVASIYHAEEKVAQLISLGLTKENIVEYAPEKTRLKKELKIIQRKVNKMEPRKRLQFEVNLADHCDLNCTRCNHFSPIAKEKYADFQTFEKDIARLSYLFKGESDRIILLGGEPLLNAEITKFMTCVRRAFTDSKVLTITNGLLIPKMDDAFFECCISNNIEIWITKYPIKNVYERIEQICESKGIVWKYFNNAQVQKESAHFPLDLEGKQNCEVSFANCGEGNECITLKEGKLYPCPTVAHVEHFNQYFGYNLPVEDIDGVDIYKAKSGEEILEHLSNPIPFCRFCDVSRRTYHHKWGISKKELTEWT